MAPRRLLNAGFDALTSKRPFRDAYGPEVAMMLMWSELRHKFDPELLKEAVTRLDALEFQVHFHALGDRAVRESLDAVEAVVNDGAEIPALGHDRGAAAGDQVGQHSFEAFAALGMREALARVDEHATGGGGGPLKIMYRIDGSPDLNEEVLEHWEGYRGSHPVRIV